MIPAQVPDTSPTGPPPDDLPGLPFLVAGVGTSATERIRRERPGARVLALTVHENRGSFQQLLQAGVSGNLLKGAAADDLIHAIRTVARGGTYLDPSLAGRVLGDLASRSSG